VVELVQRERAQQEADGAVDPGPLGGEAAVVVGKLAELAKDLVTLLAEGSNDLGGAGARGRLRGVVSGWHGASWYPRAVRDPVPIATSWLTMSRNRRWLAG
jgi:hypothetical protein